MAEMEPGHPDELVQALCNWLEQARSPIGSLPAGINPVEWAVRQFVDCWKNPARNAIDSVEETLSKAMEMCDSGGSLQDIKNEIDLARQTLDEDLRDHLGLYDWNKE